MSATTVRVVILTCDHTECGALHEGRQTQILREVRQGAASDGWSVKFVGGGTVRDYCPEHSQGGKA